MKRYPLTLFLLSVALLLLACLSLALGSADLSLSSLFAGLCGREGYETERAILLYVRLPRLLAAMLAGVGLSLSGVLLQDVMGNALAGGKAQAAPEKQRPQGSIKSFTLHPRHLLGSSLH
ncbi:MAG: iron chelate uptake ABC transporter family permease subunit, partial [Clostridia bacterium]|nr:iron chelate uptake ABC transporter family permease subunit [Clostridia bacterium]